MRQLTRRTGFTAFNTVRTRHHDKPAAHSSNVFRPILRCLPGPSQRHGPCSRQQNGSEAVNPATCAGPSVAGSAAATYTCLITLDSPIAAEISYYHRRSCRLLQPPVQRCRPQRLQPVIHWAFSPQGCCGRRHLQAPNGSVKLCKM